MPIPFVIVWLVTFIISAVLAIVLAPKPPDGQPAATLSQFNVPTAEEGRALPVLFGTDRLRDPNTVWYGHLRTANIAQSGQVIGHKYYLGIHMLVCYMVEAVREIWVGEKKVWGWDQPLKYYRTGTFIADGVFNGSMNQEKEENASVFIHEPATFGGDRQEGGIEGWVDIEFGKADQSKNRYMQGTQTKGNLTGRVLGTPTPIELRSSEGVFENTGADDDFFPIFEHTTEDFSIWTAGTGQPYFMTSKANARSMNPAHWYFSKAPRSSQPWGGWVTEALGGGILYLSASRVGTTYTSVPNSIDSNGDAHLVPAYRNLMGFVLNQVYIGTTNFPKAWSFVLRRTKKKVDGTDIWHPEIADIAGDMNPIHIIYEILTSKEFGLGRDVARIDDDSFLTAATKLYAENFGLSFKFDSSGNADDFIQEVLNYINGYLRVDNSAGTFQIVLLRDDYDIGTLDEVDDTLIADLVDFSRNTIHGLINQMSVNYTNQEVWGTGTATVQDIAKIAIQGSIISMDKEYMGVTKASLANTLATRDLKLESTPLFSCTVEGLPALRKYNVGDVFKLVWPPLGIASAIVRVVGVELSAMNKSGVRLTLVEDVFSTVFSVFSDPTGGGWEPPGVAPEDILIKKIIEIPYWHISRDMVGSDVAAALTATTGYVQVCGVKPSEESLDMDFWSKRSTSTNYALDVRNLDFVGTGSTVDALDDSPVQVEFEVGSTSSEFFGQILDTYIIIDDEYLLVVSINELSSTITVERGILDTVPAAHAIGAEIILMGVAFNQGNREYADGEIVDAKLLPATGKGVLDIEDATSFSTTIAHRLIRPYPPGNVALAQFPELRASWNHRSRTVQITDFILQTDATDYGPDALEYLVTLYRAGVQVDQRTAEFLWYDLPSWKQVEWSLGEMAEDLGIVHIDITGADAPVAGEFLPTTVLNDKYKFEIAGALIEFTNDYGGITPVEVTGDAELISQNGDGTYVWDEEDATTGLAIYRKIIGPGQVNGEIVPLGSQDKVILQIPGLPDEDMLIDEYINGEYSYRLGSKTLKCVPLLHVRAVNFTGGHNPGTINLPPVKLSATVNQYNYKNPIDFNQELTAGSVPKYTATSDDPLDPLDNTSSLDVTSFVGGFHSSGDFTGVLDTTLVREGGQWILRDLTSVFFKTDADNATGVGTYQTSGVAPVRNATVVVSGGAGQSWWVFEDATAGETFYKESLHFDFESPEGVYARKLGITDSPASMEIESAVTSEGQDRSWGWEYVDGVNRYRSATSTKTLAMVETFHDVVEYLTVVATIRLADAGSTTHKLTVNSQYDYFKSPAGSDADGTYLSAIEERNPDTGMYEYHRQIFVADGVLSDSKVWVYKSGADEFIKTSNAVVLEGEYAKIGDASKTLDVVIDPAGTLLEDMTVEVLGQRNGVDAWQTQTRLLLAP